MLKAGDVVLAKVQFTDTFETKIRPAVVLFEELGNVIITGITSNTQMGGIPLTRKEGAVQDSIIKLNYIFTVSQAMVHKILFHLSTEKKRILSEELSKRLNPLKI